MSGVELIEEEKMDVDVIQEQSYVEGIKCRKKLI